jgi:hypothetical protein
MEYNDANGLGEVAAPAEKLGRSRDIAEVVEGDGSGRKPVL